MRDILVSEGYEELTTTLSNVQGQIMRLGTCGSSQEQKAKMYDILQSLEEVIYSLVEER